MDVARARYLISRPGRQALLDFGPRLSGHGPVAVSAVLRKVLPPAEAAAIGEQLALRARAGEKLGDDASSWLLSRPGLEMMTLPAVAERRAARLGRLGLPVADLTCGLGGDLRAIAATGLPAVGVEVEPATALLAAANVPAAGVVLGDAARPPLAIGRVAVLLDPSRRGRAGRSFDPAAYAPAWDVACRVALEARAGVLKAAPGIDFQLLPPAAEIEAVEAGRSLRECTAWVGGDARPGLRRAVLLPGAMLESTEPKAPSEPAPVGAFLFDPRACVTRSGLVRQLGARIGARLLDPQVAYLSGAAPAVEPLADCFAVLQVVPFSVSAVRRCLRDRGWRPDEIRRRAFPVEPDELRRLLGVREGEPVTLLCTTVARERVVIVGRRV